MAATAKKSTTTTKKATTKTTNKTAKPTPKAATPELRKDINPAASWPFPVYTKS